MLLQLSHFPLFIPLHPAHPLSPAFPAFSSCPWVIHTSCLASIFPILFLTPPCLFSTYHLWVHLLPLCLVRQLLCTSPFHPPVFAPPTSLDECFFFNSLVVGLLYSSIFWQFWLFFVFKFVVFFFWLYDEAQCVRLRLHLGRMSRLHY